MLPDIDFNLPVYGLAVKEKKAFLNKHLLALTKHHYTHCSQYKNFIDGMIGGLDKVTDYQSIPALAAPLFKNIHLKSISDEQLFKTMHSSGTGAAGLSNIYLDRGTAQLQTRALGKILQAVVGKQRLPMLLADHNQLMGSGAEFSARGAGVQGLSMFGRDHCYLLNQDMTLDVEAFNQFYEQFKSQRVIMFGFTFMVWQSLLQQMMRQGHRYNFTQLTLLHSGGWKKLTDQAVTDEQFQNTAKQLLGENTQVVNFYGMVEQTGSIFTACEKGYLHSSIYSDIAIKSPQTFTAMANGEKGLIEVSSILPRSYPGHRLLTQDIGIIVGEDDCACGRLGKYFIVQGRQAQAEVRGCSDSYA